MARIVWDNAPDSTPYDRDGELTSWLKAGAGAHPTASTGLKGYARTFDGTAGYTATDEDSVHLGIRAVTVRALLRPDFAASAGTTVTLAARGSFGATAGEYWAWVLQLDFDAGGTFATSQWAWQDETAAVVTHAIGTVDAPPAGDWLLLSATRETAGGTHYMRLAVDGLGQAEVTATDQVPATPDEEVTLGCRNNAGTYEQFFIGDMDAIEVLDTAVSPMQERHFYEELITLPDEARELLRAYWFQGPLKLRDSLYAQYRIHPLAEVQASVDAALRRREEAGLPNTAYGARLAIAERQSRAAAALALVEGLSVPALDAFADSALGATDIFLNTADVEVDLSKTEVSSTAITADALEEIGSFTEASSGRSIASDGDWIIVGQPNATVSGNALAGRAHFYERDTGTGVWAFHSTVTDIIVAAGDEFGFSVAIDGLRAAIGVPGDTAGAGGGSVAVLLYNGAAWVLESQFVSDNIGAGDRFGTSVSLDGDRLVVGASAEDGSGTGVDPADDDLAAAAGAAYVFERSGSTWPQTAYLKASNTGAGDVFGTSVALSGDTVVVSAPQEDGSIGGIDAADDDLGSNVGAAYVFFYDGFAWAQQAKIKADNPGNFDNIGDQHRTLALQGDVLAIGARLENGSGTGINPAHDDLAADAGAVYVFRRTGAAWAQEAYIKASNAEALDSFGRSVALRGNDLLVGAFDEDSGVWNDQADNTASAAGAAYLFRHDGVDWAQVGYLKADTPVAGEQFGEAVALTDYQQYAVGTRGGTGWYLLHGCADQVSGTVVNERIEAMRNEGSITAEWDGSALLVRAPCTAADLTFDPGHDKAGIMEAGSYLRLWVEADIEVVASSATIGVGLLFRSLNEAWWLIPYDDGGVAKIRQHYWTREDGEVSAVLGTMAASATDTWKICVVRDDAGVWSVQVFGDSTDDTYTLTHQPVDGDPTWVGLIVHGPAEGGDPRARVHYLRFLWTEWPRSREWVAVSPTSTVYYEVGLDLLRRKNRAASTTHFSRSAEFLATDNDSWLGETPTNTL
jgi:hypothetical protein